MGEKALSGYTIEEYLAIEAEAADTKYEYHDGFIVAMAGGTPEHGQISTNVTTALNNALSSANKSCITYNSDVKVAIEATNRNYYSDGFVVCGKPLKSKRSPLAIANPILVVEVLSEGTEGFDRGDKFFNYRQIPTLREYVLVSQESAMVEVFTRMDDNTWRMRTYVGLEENFELQSIDCEIRMAAVYRMVEGISE